MARPRRMRNTIDYTEAAKIVNDVKEWSKKNPRMAKKYLLDSGEKNPIVKQFYELIQTKQDQVKLKEEKTRKIAELEKKLERSRPQKYRPTPEEWEEIKSLNEQKKIIKNKIAEDRKKLDRLYEERKLWYGRKKAVILFCEKKQVSLFRDKGKGGKHGVPY